MRNLIRGPGDIGRGTAVEVRLLLGQRPRRFKAKVERSSAERLVVVSGSVLGAVPAGTAAVVSLWRAYADHHFNSRVLSCQVGSPARLTLAAPVFGKIRRVPRRRLYRVETRLLARIGTAGEESTGIITDLSAGGCRLKTHLAVEEKAAIRLDFDLPFGVGNDGFDLSRPLRQIEGRVHRAVFMRQRLEEEDAFGLHIEFLHLNQVLRDLLQRYVALRQRTLLRARREGVSAALKAPPLQEEPRPVDTAAEEVPEERSNAGQEVMDYLVSLENNPLFLGAADGEKRILVVDDDLEVRTLLERALEREGFSVEAAANGEEALQAAGRAHFDLLITDLMMPRINGWRLVAALRDRGWGGPILLLTGYMTQEGRQVLNSREIAGYLIKPVSIEELVDGARRLLFPAPSTQRRIALIDAAEGDCRPLVTQLEGADLSVCPLPPRPDAVERLVSLEVDLALVDGRRKPQVGFELCQTIRARRETAALPILFMANKVSPLQVRQAVDLEINGYMLSPISPEALVERIGRILQ